jgi:hypothetical protein
VPIIYQTPNAKLTDQQNASDNTYTIPALCLPAGRLKLKMLHIRTLSVSILELILAIRLLIRCVITELVKAVRTYYPHAFSN